MTVISILLTPYIIKTAGLEAYGLWLLLMSIIAWNEVMDFGVPTAIQRAYVAAISLNDKIEINQIFSNSLAILALLAIIPIVCFSLLAYNPQWLKVTEELYKSFTLILIALTFQIAIRFMMNAVHGLYAGILRFDIISKVDMIFFVIRSLLMVCFLSFGFGVFGIAMAYILSAISSDIVKFYLIKASFPALSFDKKSLSFNFIKNWFAFGFQVFREEMATILTNKSNHILISLSGNFNLLGGFGLYQALVFYYEQILSAILPVYDSLIIKVYFRGNKRLLKLLVSEAIFCVSYLAIAMGSLMVVFSPSIIRVWIDADIIDYSFVVYFMVVAIYFNLSSRPLLSVLYAGGKLKSLPDISLFLSCSNFILSYFIISEFGVMYISILFAGISLFKAIFLMPLLIKELCVLNRVAYYFRFFRLSSYIFCQYFIVTPLVTSLIINDFIHLIFFGILYFVLILLILLLDITFFELDNMKKLLFYRKLMVYIRRKV